MRAAIIGCGGIAPSHYNGYENSALAVVCAVADVSAQSLGKAASWPGVKMYRDVEEMLRRERPDIVSVCTWPDTHAQMVELAAQSGVRGIMCEKPIALRMDEIDRMISVCTAHNVRLAGGHHWRFHPRFVKAARVIRSGALGTLRRGRAQISGTLADNGPHLVDTVRFLLGDVPAIEAHCRCERQRGASYQGYGAEDAARGVVLFQGQVAVELATGDAARTFFEITIEGDSGWLTVTPTRLEVGKLRPPSPSPEWNFRTRQFREFVEWVRGKRADYQADAQQSALSAEIVLALYESARTAAVVGLPLATKGEVIRRLYDTPAAETLPAFTPDPDMAMDGGPKAVSRWFDELPDIGKPEAAAVKRVIRSRVLNCAYGPQTRALECEWAAAYGAKCAVASTSGTAAIHTAIGALNPEIGDEIITTPITDMGSIIPIIAANCVPVFGDVDPVTGNLTPQSIAARLTPRTRAVLLVHLFGRPADLDAIGELCRQRGVALIEDCCQAHWADYRGRKVGTVGQFGCFSLQQSKQITCGDGGVTLVNDPQYAERAALFVDKGWSRKLGRQHLFVGMNYRMTELQAAVAREQLRKLPSLIERRRRSAAELTSAIRNIDGLILPHEEPDVRCAWWLYNLGVNGNVMGATPDEFGAVLRTEGVAINRRYLPGPVFECIALRQRATYGAGGFPLSPEAYPQPRREDYPGFNQFHERQMVIGWSSHITSQHVRGIAQAVLKVARHFRQAASSPPRTTEAAAAYTESSAA
jgi:dTDP-4-amino-4,6-dideoxygalactose transaminase/predicted dehydrogenase